MQNIRLDGLIGANQTMMSLMPQMKLRLGSQTPSKLQTLPLTPNRSPGLARSHHQRRLDRVAEASGLIENLWHFHQVDLLNIYRVFRLANDILTKQ